MALEFIFFLRLKMGVLAHLLQSIVFKFLLKTAKCIENCQKFIMLVITGCIIHLNVAHVNISIFSSHCF